MMNDTAQLNEALALALKLSPRERIQLIERIASSVESEIEPALSSEQPEEHWGRNLLRLLDELGPIEMKYPEIEDPVEWVKQIRRDEREKRLGDWGKEA
jgi:hypothetical protein